MKTLMITLLTLITITFIMISCASETPAPQKNNTDMGAEGQSCYPNDTCNADLLCSEGICITESADTGHLGGECYPNNTCNTDLLCNDGVCVSPSDPECNEENCLSPEYECVNNECKAVEDTNECIMGETCFAPRICRNDECVSPNDPELPVFRFFPDATKYVYGHHDTRSIIGRSDPIALVQDAPCYFTGKDRPKTKATLMLPIIDGDPSSTEYIFCDSPPEFTDGLDTFSSDNGYLGVRILFKSEVSGEVVSYASFSNNFKFGDLMMFTGEVVIDNGYPTIIVNTDDGGSFVSISNEQRDIYEPYDVTLDELTHDPRRYNFTYINVITSFGLKLDVPSASNSGYIRTKKLPEFIFKALQDENIPRQNMPRFHINDSLLEYRLAIGNSDAVNARNRIYNKLQGVLSLIGNRYNIYPTEENRDIETSLGYYTAAFDMCLDTLIQIGFSSRSDDNKARLYEQWGVHYESDIPENVYEKAIFSDLKNDNLCAFMIQDGLRCKKINLNTLRSCLSEANADSCLSDNLCSEYAISSK